MAKRILSDLDLSHPKIPDFTTTSAQQSYCYLKPKYSQLNRRAEQQLFSQCKQKTKMSHQKTPHLFINCQKNPLKVLYQVSHWDTFSWWHVNKTLTLSHHHQSFEKNLGVKANKNVVSRLPETACWQYWIQSITTFYRTPTHHYLWDNSIMLRNCWDGTKRYYITSMKTILSAPLL